MKLNNNGWSTTEMIILSSIILFSLLVSIYFISKLYGSFNNSILNNYESLESQLSISAREYLEKQDVPIQGNLRVTLSTLKKQGYISNFVDSNGKSCSGYAIATNKNGTIIYKGFISCDNYETEGYN